MSQKLAQTCSHIPHSPCVSRCVRTTSRCGMEPKLFWRSKRQTGPVIASVVRSFVRQTRGRERESMHVGFEILLSYATPSGCELPALEGPCVGHVHPTGFEVLGRHGRHHAGHVLTRVVAMNWNRTFCCTCIVDSHASPRD